jgi:hypothetical protein
MDIDLQMVLKNLREQIGQQAQEIAVLKATIETLEQDDKVE